MYSVQTKGLCHQFRGQAPVLSNIDLEVPTGSIYGFLGPNGAGKTTTLRLLLGLLKKQKGSISILGDSLQQNRTAVLGKVGSMIESPSLYGHLTALENLQLLQKIYRCPVGRIREVLETTGIAGTGKKKVSRFSLGMKQRLGIAVSLLHSPTLLILDEPTNGLDPYGIIEIRDLLKKLNAEQGITVIISSHLLSEIEKLVSHVGIISNGSMVFQGTLKALVEKQESSSKTMVSCNEMEKAKDIIRSMNLNGTAGPATITLPVLDANIIALLNRRLVENNIDVYEISTVRKDLETIFMDLINQS